MTRMETGMRMQPPHRVKMMTASVVVSERATVTMLSQDQLHQSQLLNQTSLKVREMSTSNHP